MPNIVDPTDGLISFQQALLDGEIELQRAELDPQLFVLLDNPSGEALRFTYVYLEGKTVTSLVMTTPAEPVEGIPCFQFGVAVPERFRRQGRAKSTMQAAIREMQNGFVRAGMQEFYIEAIVHTANVASQRVAEHVISGEISEGTDSNSGEPILQYLRKVQTSVAG